MSSLTFPKLIGVGGVATAGKNLFVDFSKIYLNNLGIKATSIAFAHELKKELAPILREKYGIDSFTQNKEEKVIIRPELVAWGRKRRQESNGTYWIKKVEKQLPVLYNNYDIVIIEDCRYATHNQDEAAWIKSKNGKIIYVGRYLSDNTIVRAANEEEEENDPKLLKAADYQIFWPTLNLKEEKNIDFLRGIVQNTWNSIIL